MVFLVTGGAGFIGSSFVRLLLSKQHEVIVIDRLSYAGHMENIEDVLANPKMTFVKGDICDEKLISRLIQDYKFNAIFNFAAESHVDNSINGPKVFIETNVLGTFNLLEAVRLNLSALNYGFRFVHVSTDEVFGDLEETGFFHEKSPYKPSSPYSASKAASDHLVNAWCRTFGIPTIITNCSNNYGPRQFPEKLIPRIICNALDGVPLPVYGTGSNIRDWIHVEDHCNGVWLAFEKGVVGESYCFGGNSERKNIDVVSGICSILDDLRPSPHASYKNLIQFVTDRPGHDMRYAIDSSYAENKLGFQRKYQSFEEGLLDTVKWYLNNSGWVKSVRSKS